MKSFWLKLKNWFKRCENELYPEYSCLVCGREVVDTHSLICQRCKTNLISIEGHLCSKCSMPIPEGNSLCDNCKSHELHFDKATAVYVFDQSSARLVYGIKYANWKFSAKHLASLLIPKLEQFGPLDAIIPVPLHESRKAWRGYNQSELIANALFDLTSIEVQSDVLERFVETETQQGKTKEQREANVVGAFRVIDKTKVKDKNILLVDDVFTTGSTMNECARVLKKAGANKVFVATILKTALGDIPHSKTKRRNKNAQKARQ